jgi:hypothetical protein
MARRCAQKALPLTRKNIAFLFLGEYGFFFRHQNLYAGPFQAPGPHNFGQVPLPSPDVLQAHHCHLVTGGLGGVGSEVVTAILESRGDVICLDLAKNIEVRESPLRV